jgi:hypothetical protein
MDVGDLGNEADESHQTTQLSVSGKKLLNLFPIDRGSVSDRFR